MKMNLPNKLTILRVILIIPFVVCLLLPGLGSLGRYISVAIFIIASLTDLADGKIARKYNLVTNFGKFMDPLADKLLVGAAMICLVETGQLAAWIVVIIISREFIISGFRLLASDNGVVIAASYWGKFKTTFQMVMIIMLILNFNHPVYQICCLVITYISLILTIVSLLDYVIKNRNVLKDDEKEKEISEETIAQMLKENNLTIATAESCTGGLLAGTLINVPGISENFKEGYITYSNDAKEKILDVSKETLEKYGAVSEQTAFEMAKGCQKNSGADIGIGITGIAGPDGGTEQKPVGLVYIGCCLRGKTVVNRFVFKGNRNEIRNASVEKAMFLIKNAVLEEVNQ